jgi:hypothetical protein
MRQTFMRLILPSRAFSDAYLVYKRDGMYFNPSEDGFVKDSRRWFPTAKWVKNPTLFDLYQILTTA